jgi:hypothetical protein
VWFHTHTRVILTRMCVNMTLTSVLTTRSSVISTLRVWFLHAECNFHTQFRRSLKFRNRTGETPYCTATENAFSERMGKLTFNLNKNYRMKFFSFLFYLYSGSTSNWYYSVGLAGEPWNPKLLSGIYYSSSNSTTLHNFWNASTEIRDNFKFSGKTLSSFKQWYNRKI